MIAPSLHPATPYRQNGSLFSKAPEEKPLFPHRSCRICQDAPCILQYQVPFQSSILGVANSFIREKYKISPQPQRAGRIRTNNSSEINEFRERRLYTNVGITKNTIIYQYLAKMAHFEGESSNRLFETLEEWNEFLRKYAPFFKEVS